MGGGIDRINIAVTQVPFIRSCVGRLFHVEKDFVKVALSRNLRSRLKREPFKCASKSIQNERLFERNVHYQ